MQISLGNNNGNQAERSGAVRTIGEQPFGRVVLWALVWGRGDGAVPAAQAAFGPAMTDDDTRTRRLGSGAGCVLRHDLHRRGADRPGGGSAGAAPAKARRPRSTPPGC
ncbi:hypothetical protein ABZZ47_39875 [Streptomyces sp. NPDC006465]|uniref:hypothetical protein n=1 Tax=Streptomyces sp. NPDC006465 TaxID=3157174 RepID=UPI0033B9ECBF